MATNLALDDKLIAEAVKLGKHRSKKDAVNTALADYIRRRKLDSFFELMGQIDYYDDAPSILRAKKHRAKRRSA